MEGSNVVNVIELVGDSQVSWEDAIQNAVREASKTVKGISGVEVKNLTANVKDGRLSEFKANMQLAFKVDNSLRRMRV